MALLEQFFDKIGLPPEGEREYTREALEPLLAAPESWTQLLHELYSESDEDDAYRIMKVSALSAFNQAFQIADSATWLVVGRSGLLYVLGGFVNSNYLFGLSLERFLAKGMDELDFNFIGLTLSLCATYLHRISTSREPHDLEYMKMLDILEHIFPDVFSKLWDVRDPFLTSMYASTTDTDLMEEPIHPHLESISLLTVLLLKKHRQIMLDQRNSRIPHVLLLIWIYNPERLVRTRASKGFSMITSTTEYDGFFRDFATGCTGHTHISEALIRDFKDEEVVDRELLTVILLEIIRDTAREEQLSEPGGDYQALASHSLAAVRRQLCRGNQDVDTEADIISSTLALLNQDKTEPYAIFSSRQVYECLSLLFYYVALQISRIDRDGLDVRQLGRLVLSWIPHISTLDPDDSRPKIIAAGHHALRAWTRARDELERSRLWERDEDWKLFTDIWQDVWVYMPVRGSEQDTRESPFELLRRCGWSECACSVHAPAHSMRVCKGCWLVAYCGPNCQKNDWEKGSHRQRCRRRTAAVLQ